MSMNETQFNVSWYYHWTVPYTPTPNTEHIRIKWKIDYWNRKMERWTIRKKMYQNVIEVKCNKINVNCALEWRSLLEHFSVFIVIDLPSFFVVTIFLVEYVCAFVYLCGDLPNDDDGNGTTLVQPSQRCHCISSTSISITNC